MHKAGTAPRGMTPGKVELFLKRVHYASKALAVLGNVVIVALVLLTVVDVVLRYIFNSPWENTYEFTSFMIASIGAFWIAYTASQGRHVAVDLFTAKFPQRMHAIIRSVNGFLAIVIFGSFSLPVKSRGTPRQL